MVIMPPHLNDLPDGGWDLDLLLEFLDGVDQTDHLVVLGAAAQA